MNQSPKDELLILKEFIEMLLNVHCPIIVEGKRDVIALNKFNIYNVHQLTSNLEDEARRIAESAREVIILTDLDAEGRRIYSDLFSAFNRLGIKVNDAPRKLLMKTELRQVEGLYRRVMRLESKLK